VESIVSTPATLDNPVPRSEVNVDPPNVKLVVEAVVNDPYVVEEFANVCRAVHVFGLVRSRLNALPEYVSPVPAVVVAYDPTSPL
jgi:hypothetical protein